MMSKTKTNPCQSVLRLLNDLHANLDDYTDENWCENYTIDEYFLYVLCWAGWRRNRQEAVWKKVRDEFSRLDKKLHAFQPNNVKRLCRLYPLDWQKDWLSKLVNFLKNNSLTAQNFVRMLRKMGYSDARTKLQEIVGTDRKKIVDCWLRDVVRLDAFPIDSRIKTLLQKYKIPVDSDFIIECCKKNNIPIRPFNRALYDYPRPKSIEK